MFVKIANSPGRLLATFVASMLASSLLYSWFESAAFPDSLYWSIVTATTLGYGDFAPHTTAGKVLTSVLIASTVFVFIPTITANIASKLIVNRDAFTHEEQEEIKESLRRVEAALSGSSSDTGK